MTVTETQAAPEQRTITADVQDVHAEGRTLRGHACLYGVESRDLGGYTESIAPGAFADVLAADPDVILTLNHSPDRVLGRTRSGTLRLRDEARGLAFDADLGDGPTAQDVRDMVRRGDLSGASFRFRVATDGEQWDGERRTLTRIGELYDISLATVPAYDGPRVELRTAPQQQTEDTTTTSGHEAEEDTNMNVEDRESGAGLAVEDRSASTPNVESRVMDAIRAVNRGEARSLNTTTAAAVTPEEQGTFLWDRLRPSSVVLSAGVKVIPTDRNEVVWPRLIADVDPAFYLEEETITASDPALDTVRAEPKKLAHRIELSNEVIEDSVPSVLEIVNAHLATTLALKLDAALLSGTAGTGGRGIVGLTKIAGTQTLTVNVVSSYDFLVQAVGLLAAANVAGPFTVILHPARATELALLKTTDGAQLAAPAGMPQIVTTTQIGVNDGLVFAPAQVAVVRRFDAEILLDRSRLFDRDMSEVRGRLRADLIAPHPEAVVVLKQVGVPAA